MPKFVNNRARWNAWLLSEHLKSKGITKFEPQPNGSLKFRKLGATYVLSVGPSICIEPEPRPEPRPEPDYDTSASQFEAAGNAWNARNEQHDAYRPWGHKPRANAFGDISNHPTVEGYDQWGPLGYVKPRVEEKAEKCPEKPYEGRSLYRARRRYLTGK